MARTTQQRLCPRLSTPPAAVVLCSAFYWLLTLFIIAGVFRGWFNA